MVYEALNITADMGTLYHVGRSVTLLYTLKFSKSFNKIAGYQGVLARWDCPK